MTFTAAELVRMFRDLQQQAHEHAAEASQRQYGYASQRWYDGLEAGYETAADWIQENLVATQKENSHEQAV